MLQLKDKGYKLATPLICQLHPCSTKKAEIYMCTQHLYPQLSHISKMDRVSHSPIFLWDAHTRSLSPISPYLTSDHPTFRLTSCHLPLQLCQLSLTNFTIPFLSHLYPLYRSGNDPFSQQQFYTQVHCTKMTCKLR